MNDLLSGDIVWNLRFWSVVSGNSFLQNERPRTAAAEKSDTAHHDLEGICDGLTFLILRTPKVVGLTV